ncbi:NusG domain II-containing protein [Treponema endosymbiont of Eucomonympha sp.]|uniref:NusG domain II-containing protein n=1 Tax=Treponema endosymbiont of Eucomonympha sp. TaxID=1580831 RepID=UPI000A405EED|nr:NusG domain II-containing protein [Treponema endosymbiont of Eucomonympha sp.]
MHKKASLLRPFDFVFIALSVGAAVFSFIYAAGRREGRAVAHIESPSGQWVYPLDRDEEVRIPGAIGDSRIAIRGGTVYFADSPCANKVCVIHQPLSLNGEWAACLPNKVFVRIEGSGDAGVDALAY